LEAIGLRASILQRLCESRIADGDGQWTQDADPSMSAARILICARRDKARAR